MVGWSFAPPEHVRRNLIAKKQQVEEAAAKRRTAEHPRRVSRKALIRRVYRQMVADGRLPPPDLLEAMSDG